MSKDKNETQLRWDLFIAHASQDIVSARALTEALTPDYRIYLDQVGLQPGDHWSTELQTAQQQSRMTLALIGATTYADAYYLQEEVAAAINLCRKGDHRLIPVYLDGWMDSPPYGLTSTHGISVPEEGGMDQVAERIVQVTHREDRALPQFKAAGWKDVKEINDLLNVQCRDAGSARGLQRKLATLVGIYALGREPEKRWNNFSKPFLNPMEVV